MIGILLLTALSALSAPSQFPLSDGINDNDGLRRETLDEAVISTAHLARTITTGTMASVFPPGAHGAIRFDGDAPCHPHGGLTFISMGISLMTRNIVAAGGKATYALATPLQRGVSEYAQPRAAFIGNLTILEVTQDEDARLRQCYLHYHPDAKWWLPADPHGAHTSHWARLDIEDIYYIGGFGTTGWIGHIPIDKYQKAMDNTSIRMD